MPFQPEQVGPILLTTIAKVLADHGLVASNIELCYDGHEDEETYAMVHHFYPTGNDREHCFNLATALRDCAPGSENPDVNGLFTRFFDDGTCIVAPAVVGVQVGPDDDEDEDEDDDE